MKKAVFLTILLFILTACQKNVKINLDDKFYGNSNLITITGDEVNNKKDETYIIFAYNNYCALKIPCDTIFKAVMQKYNISFYNITFEEMKKTYLYDTVKYAPSIIIVQNGKIINYLDANSDEDLEKYQDEDEFSKWLKEYINI